MIAIWASGAGNEGRHQVLSDSRYGQGACCVGQETLDAANLEDAIEQAVRLSTSLNMPQQPDAMSISDSDGNEVHVRRLGRLGAGRGRSAL